MDRAFGCEDLIEVLSTAVGVSSVKRYRICSWAAQQCTAAQNAGYNTIPPSCCGACPESPVADIGMGSSMPRAAVGALTFPSEQVERQLRKIVADRLS